ncbi:MAG: hypothetical protein QOI77_3736 [Blastocatellia bacterium]|jgi:hypothetical protein|nr:hypothetical protein [Blastocatellia bacterium]
MCHCNNHYPNLIGSVEYDKRESIENEFPGSVLGHGIASRSFRDLGDCIVNRVCEGCGT